MENRPWQLADPEQTLRDIDALCPFALGRVVVAAVALDTQRVTGARVAETGRRSTGLSTGDDDGSDLVRAIAEELVPERWSDGRVGNGITHVLVTVVCREGRVVFTETESSWLRAWRYANHFRGAFDGDVYIVTPHGWGGSIDHRAGYEPALSAVA